MNGLNYQERNDVSIWMEGKVEVFSIEIKFDGKKNIICMVYNPPSAHLDDFVGGMSQLISKVPSGASHIVMGDFNFNLLDLSSHNVDFLNFMISNDLYPLVSVPTRITGQSSTLIDNIFVRSADLKLCYADVTFPGSDHLPLVGVLKCQLGRSNKKKIKTRLMKKENLQKFVKEVSVIDWTPVFSEEESPTRALDNLMTIILPIYDTECPIKVMGPP